MSKLVKEEQWVWVVVQDPEGEEKFLGQRDEEKGVYFIPVFLEKNEANQGLRHLAKEKGRNFEVQAILYEELANHASDHGFMLFVMNGSGEVLEKIFTVGHHDPVSSDF